jgi:hypothetical protein
LVLGHWTFSGDEEEHPQMKPGEWIRSRYWLCHFLHNRHVRGVIEPVEQAPPPRVARVLGLWLASLDAEAVARHRPMIDRAADCCPDDPAFVQCLRLFAREQQYHAALLRRIVADPPPSPLPTRVARSLMHTARRELTVRYELSVVLIEQLVTLSLCRLTHQACADRGVRSIVRQIEHDARRHVAFTAERLTMEFADFNFVRRNLRRARLRGMALTALAFVARRYRGLIRAAGGSRRRFVAESFADFERVLERMVPYRRDALLARLLDQRERPFDEPTVG